MRALSTVCIVSQIAQFSQQRDSITATRRFITFAMLGCNDIIFCFAVKIKLESLGSGGQIILKSYDGSVCLCFDKHGTVVAQVSFKRLFITFG